MTDLDRRTVLRGVAITGAVGACPLLAACGSDEPSSGGSSAPSTSAEQTPSDSPSAEASTETEALASTSDIPVGGGKVFTDQKVVVVQPSTGEFVAYTAVCTHQGCIVAEVSDGTIVCPCHGSMYSIEDGSVTGGPAPAPLEEKPITVEGDNITLG